MSKKVSSASDKEFRKEIGKAIPGVNAFLALTVATYALGRTVAKRRKSN